MSDNAFDSRQRSRLQPIPNTRIGAEHGEMRCAFTAVIQLFRRHGAAVAHEDALAVQALDDGNLFAVVKAA